MYQLSSITSNWEGEETERRERLNSILKTIMNDSGLWTWIEHFTRRMVDIFIYRSKYALPLIDGRSHFICIIERYIVRDSKSKIKAVGGISTSLT